MKIPRGFFFIRNKQDGQILPFFLRVREDDILWNKSDESGWIIRTYENIGRADIEKQIDIKNLTFETTRKISMSVTLPKSITSQSTIQLTKFSNGNSILENAVIEAKLDNFTNGVSNTLVVYFFSPLGSFTQENITSLSGKLNILIHGSLE